MFAVNKSYLKLNMKSRGCLKLFFPLFILWKFLTKFVISTRKLQLKSTVLNFILSALCMHFMTFSNKWRKECHCIYINYVNSILISVVFYLFSMSFSFLFMSYNPKICIQNNAFHLLYIERWATLQKPFHLILPLFQ